MDPYCRDYIVNRVDPVLNSIILLIYWIHRAPIYATEKLTTVQLARHLSELVWKM